jgi:ribonuclease D
MSSAAILDQFQVFDNDLPDDVCKKLLSAKDVAIDTETLGLNPHRDRLCLVQICDPDGMVTALRIAKGQEEAPNLAKVMEAPGVTKVFHFARFDTAQLKHTFDIKTHPIFCTKIASKIARTYSSSHGLKTLVQELMGVELDKTSQCSDWGDAENLTKAQLAYAANDVRYLIPMRYKLEKMLAREERLRLAQRCFEALPVMVMLDLGMYGNVFDHGQS